MHAGCPTAPGNRGSTAYTRARLGLVAAIAGRHLVALPGRSSRPMLIDLADRAIELHDGRIVDGAD